MPDQTELVDAPDPTNPPVMRLRHAIGGLAAVNIFAALVAVITGTLQAHALGPAGRGNLAAITLPLTLAPLVASLGFVPYAARRAAHGDSLQRLVGSLTCGLLVIGILGMAASAPLARFFAVGNDVVYEFLHIGFLLLPVWLLVSLLLGLNQGLERWRSVISSRAIQPIIAIVALVTLYVLDELTVSTASVVFLVSSVASLLPLLPVLRRMGKPIVDFQLLASAVRFGIPASIGTLAFHANARLDQLLMIRLVDRRELGLYAVAVTVASLSYIISAPLETVILPRSALADFDLVRRAVRTMLALIGALSVCLAAAAPIALPLMFGAAFSACVPMLWILLAASLPLAAAMVLSAALTGAGHPKTPARAETATVIITIPALFLVLPMFGGLGAAAVSLGGYTVNCAIQLRAARRLFGGAYSDYVVPTRKDFAWLGRSSKVLLPFSLLA